MPILTKKINGKVFMFEDVTQYKTEALARARYLRARGNSARIIKIKPPARSGWKQAYQIWYRGRR